MTARARRLGGVGLLMLAAMWMSTGVASAQTAPPHFDDHFRKYTKRFFGVGFDWRLFKAQGLAESNLTIDAESRRGARGLMQLMPATFAEVRLKNPEFGEIHDPEWNIAAGIWYAKQLWDSWTGEVDRASHRHFMLASYNAGRLTLARAQRLAAERELDRRFWASIERIAHLVPRWQHRETLGYVSKVLDYLRTMDRQGRPR